MNGHLSGLEIVFLKMFKQRLVIWDVKTKGRIVTLTLTFTLGVRCPFTFAFAFSLDINLGRGDNVGSWNRGRAFTIRVMSVVALISFLAATLIHPHSTMLLIRVCWSSIGGLARA